jgi:pimeloyl-ACP methyl ester carboxylesterase
VSTVVRSRTVGANGLEFGLLEAGAGPLALCLHGFPDSASTWRHLLPVLAEAGFHAVAPFMRGYAPTAIPTTAASGSARWWPTPSPCTGCWMATAAPC